MDNVFFFFSSFYNQYWCCNINNKHFTTDMATTRISYSLPPNIDVTKSPLAFGTRALPKLNYELQSDQLIVRQRALMTLCDLMHDPEKVYQAIGVGEILLKVKLYFHNF